MRRGPLLMDVTAELTGDSSVGVRPSRRWLRPSARGLIDALVTQPPPATTTVLPATTTVLPATTTVLPRTTTVTTVLLHITVAPLPGFTWTLGCEWASVRL